MYSLVDYLSAANNANDAICFNNQNRFAHFAFFAAKAAPTDNRNLCALCVSAVKKHTIKKPAPELSRMPVLILHTKSLLLLFHIGNRGCQFILTFLSLELLP